MFGKRRAVELAGLEPVVEQPEIDPETGLMFVSRFEDFIEKEIARGLRYGSGSALALFEVAVVEDSSDGPVPSPARFIAHVLTNAARSSDVVARVGPERFGVLLVEAEAAGAAQFTERVRTQIGSQAYARRPDGIGLYVRAWAGVVPWEPSFDTVDAYVSAAARALSSTSAGYEAAQDWFRPTGLNKPLVA